MCIRDRLQAVKDNWVGHEKLYALVNSSKVHHYGNDDDYADELFEFMFECYCKHISGRVNPRGGKFSPGVYSVNANVAMGLNTNATVEMCIRDRHKRLTVMSRHPVNRGSV